MTASNSAFWGEMPTGSLNNSSMQVTPIFGSIFSNRELHDPVIKNTEDINKHVKKMIGVNSVNRFYEFKLYKDGWDNGRGKKLSTRSIAVFEFFLSSLKKFDDEPSLFFTRNGNLQLGWEDSNENVIEIEFYPEKIEYYLESTSEEDEIGIIDEELTSLVEKINRL